MAANSDHGQTARSLPPRNAQADGGDECCYAVLVTRNTQSLASSTALYAFGVAAIAVVNLALGALDPMQPLPLSLPWKTEPSYVASSLMLLAAIGLAWARCRAWCAAILAVYFGIVVALVMNVPVAVGHHLQYGSFFGVAEGFALSSPALLILVETRLLDATPARRTERTAQCVFACCAIFFGGAHFAYPAATIPLVPAWLPPSQAFWAYATGLFHIAAGVAVLIGVRARLATMLLAMMYAAFTPLVHLPLLLSDPSNHFYWTENALNLALVGAAWVVADSLRGVLTVIGPGVVPSSEPV